jgi:hypothetical protein
VLPLWAAIVAEQLGYDKEIVLTLGKVAAGLNANLKGGDGTSLEKRTLTFSLDQQPVTITTDKLRASIIRSWGST